MSMLRKYRAGLVLLLLCGLVRLQASDNQWVETTYVNSIFLPLQGLWGGFFSLFSFSMGDFLYGLLFLLFLTLSTLAGRKLYRSTRKDRKSLFVKYLYLAICSFLSLYLIFNVLWGNNYNRLAIAHKLGLAVKTAKEIDLQELQRLNGLLVSRVNENRRMIVNRQLAPPSRKEIFSQAYEAYDGLAGRMPEMEPVHRSLKASLWSWLGNYSGFTGYYNPFTGEAQVNTDVPVFLQPYIACHEIAHQLGYAKEMEANFVGYLAASRSANAWFRYSVYLDLFLYANGMVYTKDTSLAREWKKKLRPEVLEDLREWQAFRLKHRNLFEPLITRAYDLFLKSNRQPEGMGSYAAVTAFLLAYEAKYGTL